jgi:membrane protein implicated in regulation of membrane protease activity
MTYVFIGLVCLGLLSGVRVMLYGVERDRAAGDASPRSFSASPALIATFCIVAGSVGYSALRLGLRPAATWLAAVGVGAIAAFGASRLIAAWWTVVPEHDIDDERYVLQGSLGRVVAAIAGDAPGKVSLESSGHKEVLPARAIDDQAMAVGTEVVIERIEDGVAYVEDWAAVEKRL